jgi:hypothetical protein
MPTRQLPGHRPRPRCRTQDLQPKTTMRILTLAFLATVAACQLAAAEPRPASAPAIKPTYAARPYAGSWLTTWIEAAKAPAYAHATAHEPNYADKALWPAVTDEDGIPAYKTYAWPKARLLIWNRRDDEKAGKQADVVDPANWLQDGKPALEGPDEETDVVFPDSETRYFILCSAGDKFQRGFSVRHITVGKNATVSVFGLGCNGNWWIRNGGSIYERHSGAFVGKHSTFARNDNTPAWRPCPTPRPPEQTDDAWPFASQASQYFHITKPGAEVEIVGNFSSQDQFHINDGTLIVGPDSYLGTGMRATLSIHEKGTFQLQSGAAVAKLTNQTFANDIEVKGLLRAGSPARPIHRDCMVGLSAKDYIGEVNGGRDNVGCGLVVQNPQGLVVHQAVAEAKMRIQWSGVPLRRLREQAPPEGNPERAGWLIQRNASERFNNSITVAFWGNTAVENVRFDDVRLGGLSGVTAEQAKTWKNVTFGERNMGPLALLCAPANWATSLVILPNGPLASLPAGKPVQCEILSCQPECETRYTIDGSEPTVSSPLYARPFPLSATTVVQARLFFQGRAQGDIARCDYLSVDKPLSGASGRGKTAGLAYTAGKERNGVISGKQDKAPALTGVTEAVRVMGHSSEYSDNFSLRLSGFLNVPVTGTYTLWITCATHPTAVVRLAGTRICAKNCNQGEVDSRAIALAQGNYPLEIAYSRSWWGENTLKMEWEGPGIARQEIPPSAFSH